MKTHLTELARHYHAAQKSKASADYQEAVKWYRAYIAACPNDPETAQNNFLLAELLYEDKHLARGRRRRYEGRLPVPQPRQGGRRRLCGAAQLRRAGEGGAGAKRWRRCSVPASTAPTLRQAFPRTRPHRHRADQRVGEAVRAARSRQRRRRAAGAQLDRRPPPQRRVAWTVVAHSAFDKGRFAEANRPTAQVLALVPEGCGAQRAGRAPRRLGLQAGRTLARGRRQQGRHRAFQPRGATSRRPRRCAPTPSTMRPPR